MRIVFGTGAVPFFYFLAKEKKEMGNMQVHDMCVTMRSVSRRVSLLVTLTQLAWSMQAHRGMVRQPVGMLPTLLDRVTI